VATTRKQWVIGGAVVLGIVLLVSAHNSEPPSGTTSSSTAAGASRPCMVTVTADQLSVRSSPDGNASVVKTYSKGAVVSADRTTRNGFRQLQPGYWAAQEYLNPTPDSDCG
jgi:hypothetical protein